MLKEIPQAPPDGVFFAVVCLKVKKHKIWLWLRVPHS